jgi:hypothetical protein
MCDLATLLLKGFTACAEVTTPAPLPAISHAYESCLDAEAEAKIKDNGLKPISKQEFTQEAGRVAATCTARLGWAPHGDSRDVVAASDAMLRAGKAERRQTEMRRKQAELDAPRMEAASRKYGACLFGNVRVLALAAAEPAEVVTQAAFAACREERKMVSENDMMMEAADQKLTGNLLLEVMKMRAAPRSPSKSAPTVPAKPKTTI